MYTTQSYRTMSVHSTFYDYILRFAITAITVEGESPLRKGNQPLTFRRAQLSCESAEIGVNDPTVRFVHSFPCTALTWCWRSGSIYAAPAIKKYLNYALPSSAIFSSVAIP